MHQCRKHGCCPGRAIDCLSSALRVDGSHAVPSRLVHKVQGLTLEREKCTCQPSNASHHGCPMALDQCCCPDGSRCVAVPCPNDAAHHALASGGNRCRVRGRTRCSNHCRGPMAWDRGRLPALLARLFLHHFSRHVDSHAMDWAVGCVWSTAVRAAVRAVRTTCAIRTTCAACAISDPCPHKIRSSYRLWWAVVGRRMHAQSHEPNPNQ